MSIKDKLENMREDDEKLVLIKGFGRVTRTQLQAKIKRELAEAMKYVTNGDYKHAYNILYWTGVMEAMLKTELEEIQKEEGQKEPDSK